MLFSLISCTDLEDTYKEMAGDGPIRYIGKCKDISIEPRWEKLELKWINSIDATITNIKITWKNEDIIKDTLLPKESTMCVIPNLQDGSYEVTIQSIDEYGVTSLPEIIYGRPFSMNHEIVRGFTRVVTKHFIVSDRLVMFFDSWEDNLEAASVDYTDVNGVEKSFELTREILATKYYLLPDRINTLKPVNIRRQGYIEDCEDLIDFEPYELKHGYAFATDFKYILWSKYGQSDVEADFVENIEELEIDFSITTLEDILYFPKLKKIHLAKNRFQSPLYLSKYGNASVVNEKERSLFALKLANELFGIEVERYNSHFELGEELSFLKEMGNPEIPVRDFISLNDLKYKCVIGDDVYEDSNLDRLFDDDLFTAWLPETSTTSRKFEIEFDLGTEKSLSGIQVAQRSFDPVTDPNYDNLKPTTISVMLSSDGGYWRDATYVSENKLGDTVGEVTELMFEPGKRARYVKFIIVDVQHNSNFAVSLSELKLFVPTTR